MYKKILSLLKKEGFAVIILIFVLIGFSYGPLLKIYLTPLPAGKVFLGSYGFPPDFWGNVISYKEGRLGHWLYVPKIISSISSSGSLLKIEYQILGQISRLFPIDQVIFFHLSRFALSIIFLLVSYQLIHKVLNNKMTRLMAFILSLFSTGAFLKFNQLTDFWTPIGVFQRSAYYHHYLLAFIFILLSIIFLSQALAEKKPSKLLIASIFGFLTAFIHAANIISIYLTFPFYLLVLVFKKYKQKLPLKDWWHKPIYLFIFTLISVLPLIYLLKLGQTFPWSLFPKNEQRYNISSLIPTVHFILDIGPTLLLGIIGSFYILRRKDDLSLLLAPWSLVYILGYVFFWKFINFNSQRFLQTPFFIILGLLSAIALEKLILFLSSKIHLSKGLLTVVLTSIVLLTSLPSMRQSLWVNIGNFSWAGDYTYYSTKDILDGVNWLAKNTKETDVVLAHIFNAELISVLAGNIVYANIHGFELETFHVQEKAIVDFYASNQNPEYCKKFLEEQKISYVFWSNKEKELIPVPYHDFSFLEEVYKNSTVSIYKYSLGQ